MKYLLVLLVVGIGLWTLVARLRGPQRDAPAARPKPPAAAAPVVMVQCAHCGLHLASADAVPDGPHLYCSDAHRRLGPAPNPPA